MGYLDSLLGLLVPNYPANAQNGVIPQKAAPYTGPVPAYPKADAKPMSTFPPSRKPSSDEDDDSGEDFGESVPAATQNAISEADKAGDISGYETVAPPQKDQQQLAAAVPVGDDNSVKDSITTTTSSPTPTPTPTANMFASMSGIPKPADASFNGAPNKNIGDVIQKLLGSDAFTDRALADAQSQSRNNKLYAGLGKAINMMGAAIGGIKPQYEVFDDLEKQANSPVEALMNRQKLVGERVKSSEMATKLEADSENSSANSDTSKFKREFARGLLAKIGMPMNISDNTPGAVIDKMFPGMEGMVKAQDSNSNKRNMLDSKHGDKIYQYSTKMGEDIDPNRPRGGEMGKNQARVNAGDRVETLISRFPDFNIPKIQTRELATAVNSLLTNGSQNAVTQINELVPHGLQSKASEISEWVTGNPTGLQQQQFIKLFYETALAEKKTAQHQILDAQFNKAYGTHGGLKQMGPEGEALWYNNLSHHTHIPVEKIKEMESQPGFMGQYDDKFAPNPGKSPVMESKITNFMKKNGVQDRDEAVKILKTNKFIPEDYK